jgi:hypothetical protein
MKKIIFITTILSLIIITACKQETVSNSKPETAKTEQTKSAAAKDGEQYATKIEFSTEPNEVKKDEQANLFFTVKNSSGEVVKNLKIVHEKPMHLIVVSGDLNEFYHLHPELQSDGSYKVPFAFANGGKYQLFVDVTTPDDKQIIRSIDLEVKGEIPPNEPLKVDEKFEQATGGIRVEMKPDGELVSGKEMLLAFKVTDVLTKKPVTDLENYLGEKAHFVVISQDLQEFVHAHPMSMDAVKNEHSDHNHGGKSEVKLAANADTTVSAHLTFPKAGIYKIWAEFKRNGGVIAVPFVVEVKENKEPAPKAMNFNVPKDAYKVLVSKDGFLPSEISFTAGKFNKLAFVRIDKENCANEVVFKDLNITKKLPVGEVVLVDLPADAKGKTLNFACGMDMYKGKLMVE